MHKLYAPPASARWSWLVPRNKRHFPKSSPSSRYTCIHLWFTGTSRLLLRPQHRLTDVAPSEPYVGRLLDLEDGVHRWKLRARPLQICHMLYIDVCLNREVFLRHSRALLVLELRPC